jgi:L-ascorbate metabolism protein UlaG (beta-lactamase superfamily)
MGPEGAVKAHGDLRARTSIAMHFGVFPLGDDGQHEAVEALQAALKDSPFIGSQFLAPQWGSAISVQ